MNALYVVATWVPRRTALTVGALGSLRFERGWYAYVGSAARAREARVARHMTAAKPLRWHADYLFAVHPASLAWLVDTEFTECRVVDVLCAQVQPLLGSDALAAITHRGTPFAHPVGASRTVPRFGASDCGCAGHLLRLDRRPSTASLRARLAAASVRPADG